jgi:hypothetical protein
VTRLEEAVWAAAYVMELFSVDDHGGHPMCSSAVRRADEVVMCLRKTVSNSGRLHSDDWLERERVGADVPLYRAPEAPEEA